MSAAAAADRIELCRELSFGGLTPPPSQVANAARWGIPVMVLVRPRPGDFVYGAEEHAAAVRAVRQARDAGAAGVVVGCLTGDAGVHKAQLSELVQVAGPLPVTFHKAFDACRDPDAAFEACAETGIRRILTSGGAETALDGAERLARLAARPGPAIVAAGRIRANHVVGLVRRTGVREVHARAEAIAPIMCALRAATLVP